MHDNAPTCERKTGHPVRFELTEQTRQAIDDYIRAASVARSRSPVTMTRQVCPETGRELTARRDGRRTLDLLS
jgi:hypothetical protein